MNDNTSFEPSLVGIATVVKRKAILLEDGTYQAGDVLDVKDYFNTMTFSEYGAAWRYGSATTTSNVNSAHIAISEVVQGSQNEFVTEINNTVVGYIPTGFSNLTISSGSLSTDPDTTYSFFRRYDPGVSVRNITSVGIAASKRRSSASDSFTNSLVGLYPCAAYVVLNPSCVQNTNEILDVFYRVQVYSRTVVAPDQIISYDQASNAWRTNLNAANVFSTSPENVTNPVISAHSTEYGDSIQSSDLPLVAGSANSTLTQTEYNQEGTAVANLTLGPTRTLEAGTLISHISRGIGFTTQVNFATATAEIAKAERRIKISKPSAPLQNIFINNANSVLPFNDVNNLGSSTGLISVNASGWTDPDFPMHMVLKIVNSGNVGTATYRVMVRRFAQFYKNSYGSVPRSYLNGVSGGTAGNSPWSTLSTEVCPTKYLTKLNSSQGFINGEQYCVTAYHDTTAANLRTKGFYKKNINTVYAMSPVTFFTGPNASPTISFMNLKTGKVTDLNQFSTPAIDVSGAGDCITLPDERVWVASRTQGILQISENLGSVTTVAGPTGIGIDGTKCYGLSIKENGQIWAAFEGCLAKSTNNGSSWTVYNSTTNPQFAHADITTGANWSRIRSLICDPYDVTNVDNVALIYMGDNMTSYVRTILWRASTSSPTSNATQTMNITSAIVIARMALGAYAGIKHQFAWDNLNNFWDTNLIPRQTVRRYVTPFGGTRATVAGFNNNAGDGRADMFFNHILMIRESDGNVRPLTIWAPVVGSSNFSIAELRTYNANGTVSKTYAAPSYYPATAGFLLTTANTANTVECSYGSLCPLVYMGYGIFFSSGRNNYGGMDISGNNTGSPGNSGYRFGYQVASMSPGNFNGANDGADFVYWEEYGWNGSAWVKDNPGNRTTAGTAQALPFGLTVSWTNGTGTSFVAGNRYQFCLFDGLVKDTSTATTVSAHFSNVESKNAVTFTPGSVPSAPISAITEYVGFGIDPTEMTAARSEFRMPGKIGTSSSFGVALDGMQIYPDNVSNIVFNGNFKLEFQISRLDRATCFVGLIAPNTSFLTATWQNTFQEAFMFDYNAGTRQTRVRHSGNNTNVNIEANERYDTVYSIERVGTTITYKIDGTTVFTRTGTSADLRVAVTGTKASTGTTVRGNGRDSQAAFREIKMTWTPNFSFARIGTNAAGTGIYKDRFWKVIHGTDYLQYGNFSMTLNGVNAPAVNIASNSYATTVPPAGQVYILRDQGWLVFNPADVGKTISGSVRCLYLPSPGTPAP